MREMVREERWLAALWVRPARCIDRPWVSESDIPQKIEFFTSVILNIFIVIVVLIVLIAVFFTIFLAYTLMLFLYGDTH